MLEDNTMLVDIEICWTKGKNRQKQTDTYIYQLYISQLKRSKDYQNMKKIIQILIESYDYFHKDKLVYDVVFMEQNLAKLKNISYNKIKEADNKLGWLLYFLICDKKELLKDIYKGDKFMEDVVKEAREIAGDFDMDLYIPEEEVQRRDIKEAVNRGYIDGYQNGVNEMIINMYNKNIDIKTISEISNISIENIKNIISNLKSN